MRGSWGEKPLPEEINARAAYSRSASLSGSAALTADAWRDNAASGLL